MSLSIIRPGLLTTIQDLGRPGYQQAGIPVSGALDASALRVANWLVGNPDSAAALEITLTGPRIRFEADHLLALTGADLSPTIQGEPVKMGRPVAVTQGSVLTFGAPRRGCRTYLAVSGSFAIAPVLGSHATYTRAALGGWHGRALQAGDQLPCPGPTPTGRQLLQALSATSARAYIPAKWTPAPRLYPQPEANPIIRAIKGPEYEQFTAESQAAFWQREFQVTPASDRMGARLLGSVLVRHNPREMLSSAVTFGTVQVPPQGQPIILLADRQTIGGYPRIAQVITADFSRLAQVLPGQTIRFQEVSLEAAQYLYIEQEQALRQLKQALAFKIRST